MKIANAWLIFASLIGCIFSLDTQIECVDENNEKLDWFILYKVPKLTTKRRLGAEHYKLTSKSMNWTLSSALINDSESSLAKTWSMFKKSPQLKILYNDQPSKGKSEEDFAHMKGALAFSDTTGVWLMHTVPELPQEDSTSPFEMFNYPSTGFHYGQTFFCMTLSFQSLSSIVQQLLVARPYVYKQSQASDEMKSKIDGLDTLLQNKAIHLTVSSVTKFTSLSGELNYVHFSKSSQFGKDFYDAFVAPSLKKSLQAETWRNEKGHLPSYCEKPYEVENINNIQFSSIDAFHYSKDHSKWAISSVPNWICMADINRDTPQFVRGGGAVCFQNNIVWKEFSSVVKDLEKCVVIRRKNYDDENL